MGSFALFRALFGLSDFSFKQSIFHRLNWLLNIGFAAATATAVIFGGRRILI
jgi:hypothetical protein